MQYFKNSCQLLEYLNLNVHEKKSHTSILKGFSEKLESFHGKQIYLLKALCFGITSLFLLKIWIVYVNFASWSGHHLLEEDYLEIHDIWFLKIASLNFLEHNILPIFFFGVVWIAYKNFLFQKPLFRKFCYNLKKNFLFIIILISALYSFLKHK